MATESLEILLVEDNPGDAQLLEHSLKQVRNLEYTIRHVDRLGGLGEALKSGSIDVLLLDLNLPDSRGLATVNQAIAQAPHLPVIVLTSLDEESTGLTAMHRGAQDYLVKGEVDGWQIVKSIRYAMERKLAQRELQYSLDLAGEAQRALLPAGSPPDWHLKAVARSRMRSNVGGDFYEFLRVAEDRPAVFIGDVMGHDVRAALLMARILGCLRTEKKSRVSQIIAEMNRSLMALGNKIGNVLTCSLFCAEFDVPGNRVHVVTAGNPPGCLYNRRSRAVSTVGSHGLLLGVQPMEFVETQHVLSSGDRLVLFTDGVLDASNASAQRFGQQRMVQAIRQFASLGTEAFAEAVLSEVESFRQGAAQVDDESVVVVDCP